MMSELLRPLFLLLALLAGPGVCLAGGLPDAGDEDDEPPVVGRPENYSGLVGSFRVAASVAAAEVAVEDPVMLTVRVTGTGKVPGRPALRLLAPDIENDFHVADVPERDRAADGGKEWAFVYQLRPKRRDVDRVPALELAYYNPAFRSYQSDVSPAVPLKVVPRGLVTPSADEVKLPGLPDSVFEIATGPGVLRRNGPAWPGWPVVALIAFGPPALCAVWYFLWRRRHGGAAVRREQRRSAAGKQALAALESAAGERAGAVVVQYLRHRLDLPGAEPTPREAARHLRRLGVTPPLAREVAQFFRSCDAARFAPAARAAAELAGEARRLILALEEETCSPSW